MERYGSEHSTREISFAKTDKTATKCYGLWVLTLEQDLWGKNVRP